MKNRIVMTVGVMSLISLTGTALATDDKAASTMQKMAEKAMANPAGVTGELLTMTAQVQAIDIKERELTLKDREGNVFVIDVPPEVRRLDEINVGDRGTAQYRQALALGLSKMDGGGVNVTRTTVGMSRASQDASPGGVIRENVEALATVAMIDKANRTVIIKGAIKNVTLKVPENINLDAIKVGDQVLATYVQELAVSVSPPSPAQAEAWNQ